MVALCRSMAPANASERVVVVSCGRKIFVSLCSLVFMIGEMRRQSGAWSVTEFKEVGWEVISNDLVGTTSRSGSIGWVVYVVYCGCHPHRRGGGIEGAVLVFFLGDDLPNL